MCNEQEFTRLAAWAQNKVSMAAKTAMDAKLTEDAESQRYFSDCVPTVRHLFTSYSKSLPDILLLQPASVNSAPDTLPVEEQAETFSYFERPDNGMHWFKA